MHLADLGAEVVKIEGDRRRGRLRARRWVTAPARTEDSYYFRMVNRNKRSLKLDLKQPAGVEVFMRLAQDADVIVEGFRPGVTDKLGIGYEAVQGDQSAHRLLRDHRLRPDWAVGGEGRT